MEQARADALAVAVPPGAAVLLVGPPPTGLGEALDVRGCKLTVLAPPGVIVVEPWATRVGTVDEIHPDPGSLGPFDAIVAPHLLDQAADPAASLRRFTAALGPSGRVVLMASRPPPVGALHLHDAAHVERQCELAGLSVQTVTVVGGSTIVVARGGPTTPSPSVLDDRESAQGAMVVAIDRRLRDQQARIRALEEEVRELRAVVDHPPFAAVVARVVRLVRTRVGRG